MKHLSSFSLLLCAAGLTMAGCGKDVPTAPSPTASSSDTQTFSTMIDQEPALSEGDTYESPGEGEFADGSASAGLQSGSFSTEEAIRPIYFYRVIRDRSRSIDVHAEEDSNRVRATVVVTDRLAGSFNLVTADTTDSGVVRHLIKKPLKDVSRFRAVFVRWKKPSPDDPDALTLPGLPTMDDWSRWHLVGISSREIHSPENTAKITSVRLQTDAGLDVTIDDPASIWRFPRGLIAITANTQVHITVQVADPTDAVFLLAGWGHQRLRKTTAGFEGTFRAPYELRLFRFGVNVLDHATLFDDQGAYDSDFWGIPARTVPPAVASN